MRGFTVKISYSVTLFAEDENEAKDLAIDYYDFGSADYEVIEHDLNEEVSSNGKTTGSKPVDVGSIPTASAKLVIKGDDNG